MRGVLQFTPIARYLRQTDLQSLKNTYVSIKFKLGNQASSSLLLLLLLLLVVVVAVAVLGYSSVTPGSKYRGSVIPQTWKVNLEVSTALVSLTVKGIGRKWRFMRPSFNETVDTHEHHFYKL